MFVEGCFAYLARDNKKHTSRLRFFLRDTSIRRSADILVPYLAVIDVSMPQAAEAMQIRFHQRNANIARTARHSRRKGGPRKGTDRGLDGDEHARPNVGLVAPAT
jgi:hypothetical protein